MLLNLMLKNNNRKYDNVDPNQQLVDFLSKEHSYQELYHIAVQSIDTKGYEDSLKPIVYSYPNFKDINSTLKDLVVSNATIKVNGGGMRTEVQVYDGTDPEEINILFTWVLSLIPDIVGQYRTMSRTLSPKIDDISSYSIVDYWGMHYSKGQSAIGHNHFPYTFSLAYYISTPEGCSALTMDDQSYDVQEGDLIIWPSELYHCVRPSDVDGRVMISANISYLPKLDKPQKVWYK